MTDDRAQIEDIARQVMRDPELEWVRPLARAWLAAIAPDPVPALCGEAGRVVPAGVRESGP